MIVYGEREQVVNALELLREVENIRDPTERLVRFGQWESAVLDALCPEADDDVDALHTRMPTDISIRPQEGFAYYGLYPTQYRDAALRFARERRPNLCVVVGIRSIGAPLSTVVAEALGCPVWRFTVRPRGHPFNRHVCLTPALAARVREHSGAWFLVVDEGPGLSGSSFASVAEALNSLGVPDDRIVFFPSHDPDPQRFVSEGARLRWPRHARYVEAFEPARIVPTGSHDWSAGLWRESAACSVAVQPHHERRKYYHERQLWKFAGLAHYGTRKLHRARELADAGFTSPVVDLRDGFLVTEFIPGTQARMMTDELLDTVASYIQFLMRHYVTKSPVRYEELVEMIRVNTGIEMPARNPVIENQCVTAIDGRMLPHEWILCTDGRWIKVDALDHHDDHLFPGCQDIAWDIAGAAVEFGIPAVAITSRLTPEPDLEERVAFYTHAYLAFRIGYCDMAAQALAGSEDGRRFAALKKRYTAAFVGSTVPPSTSFV